MSAALQLPTQAGSFKRRQHVMICVADHFEPYYGGGSSELARARTRYWLDNFPESVAGIADSLGRCPQHSFFYPAEEYDPYVLDDLAQLCHSGYGDVEIHLHHDDDSPECFLETIETFKQQLSANHGLLRSDHHGDLRYGFIHGNWALDNARPDGRWCGLDNEIELLIRSGCYADFTLPCAPAPGQTRMVNSIYYATPDRSQPKSHDWGVRAEVGRPGPDNSLLMIQGPLAWNFSNRKWGLLPRLENGDLHGENVPSLSRLGLWLGCGVSVLGRGEWMFIKLHTHGAMEVNRRLFFGGPMRRFHELLASVAAEYAEFNYYYATPWEMAQVVHAIEQGAADPASLIGADSSALKEVPR